MRNTEEEKKSNLEKKVNRRYIEKKDSEELKKQQEEERKRKLEEENRIAEENKRKAELERLRREEIRKRLLVRKNREEQAQQLKQLNIDEINRPISSSYSRNLSQTTKTLRSSSNVPGGPRKTWDEIDEEDEKWKRGQEAFTRYGMGSTKNSQRDSRLLNGKNFSSQDLLKNELHMKGPPEFNRNPIPSHFFGIHKKIVRRAKQEVIKLLDLNDYDDI